MEISYIDKLTKISAVSGILSGICFFLFWFGFFFFPIKEMPYNYSALILHPMWTIVNLFQVLAALFGLLFIIGFYVKLSEQLQMSGLISFLILIAAFVFLSGIAFYETFLWKLLTRFDNTITDIFKGPVYKNVLFMSASGTGLLFFAAGFITLGISLFKINVFSKVFLIFLISGSALFGFGALSGGLRYIIQTAGAALYSSSIVYLGIKLYSIT